MPTLGREMTMREHRGATVRSYSMGVRRSSCQKHNSRALLTEILHGALQTHTRCVQGAEVTAAGATQWDGRGADGKGDGRVK